MSIQYVSRLGSVYPLAAGITAIVSLAHTLRGSGGTYGFPLITRVASSLCKMTDHDNVRMKAPLFLIDAHIDAIKAIVRDQIRDEEHPVGTALAAELERKVAEHLASL